MNPITNTKLSPPTRIRSAGEMQPIPKRMDFTSHSHSMPTGIDIDNRNGNPRSLSKPAFMFTIHPYRKNRRSNRGCSRCHELQSSTCDCNLSPLVSQEPMKAKEWNVESVQTIPSYFCIERSHEYYDDLTPCEISKRISGCLSALSIQDSFSIKYDDEEVSN